ncbi:Replication factor A [Candidatus Tiddalikarchaeum anstoanum]|nr:Replication factor A [Candidatus Tiddalikarchaeum anstoanum]
MEFNEIIERIVKSTNLSAEVLNSKINDKIAELDNLVSKEGAAHIIANELGVNLIDSDASQDFVNIKNLVGGLRNVIVLGKVTDTFPVTTFEKDGKKKQVGSLSLNDGTGFARVVFWDDSINIFKNIKENDIIKVINAYVKENKFGKLELHVSYRTKVRVNPDDIDPKSINATDKQSKAEFVDIVEIKPDSFVKCFGAIVQVYKKNIFFNVCPQCGKSIKSDEGLSMCSEHGKVSPSRKMFVTFVLDDGTGTIRCTSFGRDAEVIMGMPTIEAIKLADSHEDSTFPVDSIKSKILGKEVFIYGRTSLNTFTNSIEIITSRIVENIDYNVELKRIAEEVEFGDKN